MPTRVFFCYDSDDLRGERIELVRRHWQAGEGHEDTGIFDHEDLRGFTLSGSAAVKELIAHNLGHTSVTCVLIGASTWQRRWVRYSIVESIVRGNRVVGLHINSIPDRSRGTTALGRNPLEVL